MAMGKTMAVEGKLSTQQQLKDKKMWFIFGLVPLYPTLTDPTDTHHKLWNGWKKAWKVELKKNYKKYWKDKYKLNSFMSWLRFKVWKVSVGERIWKQLELKEGQLKRGFKHFSPLKYIIDFVE